MVFLHGCAHGGAGFGRLLPCPPGFSTEPGCRPVAGATGSPCLRQTGYGFVKVRSRVQPFEPPIRAGQDCIEGNWVVRPRRARHVRRNDIWGAAFHPVLGDVAVINGAGTALQLNATKKLVAGTVRTNRVALSTSAKMKRGTETLYVSI